MPNDIFSIKNLTHAEGKLSAGVIVNENSDILKGHFPGQPVVPGACMLQLVKDVLESVIKHKLQLKRAEHIKFLSMIIPEGEKELQLVVSVNITEDGAYAVQAALCSGDVTCFKFQGSFKTL